ncbi:hypothetical protein TRFO_07371 [Tritrichomonas foetus]|uniref:Dynein regulatory complex protein 10 n=1 Tax=Tritrichomonas foetus TaxID=1144522 RepID=A0A1J4JRQ5_9EUKA|nr:hypothetical protein TRFO_07371 [Tritrichomonas foetus]|eukprot:OHT01815.1 hypothetical protein TRFO_07371 [Tritrichomonas foetus]
MEGRDNLDEEIQVAFTEFLNRQHDVSSAITSDGEAKQDRQADLKEVVDLYKDCARDMVRVMKKHQDFFSPLIQQAGNAGGSSAKIITMMKELNDMMNLEFSTPVESDQKQKRMMQEIQLRKKSSREFIDQLHQRLANLNQDRDRKIRQREDLLDETKQQLQQARASEAAMQQEDLIPEEIQSQEEALKQQLNEAKTELSNMQKTNSDDEQRQRKALRREEEALQTLIQQYDTVMSDVTQKIAVASVEAEKRESEFSELQSQYDDIERQRAPLKHEEEGIVARTNEHNKKQQIQLAATILLQTEIRKFLKDAPKPPKKKGKKGKKKK